MDIFSRLLLCAIMAIMQLMVHCASQTAKANRSMPVNIQTLGRGYDIFQGNPMEWPPTGYMQNVVALTFNRNVSSADGKWLIPDFVDVTSFATCNFDQKSDTVMTMTSYQHTLTKSVKIEVGTPWLSARFSATGAYEETRSYIGQKTYYYMRTSCITYQANIQRYQNFAVTENFAKGVASLPVNTSSDSSLTELKKFVSTFGTHYVDSISMGSQAIMESQFTYDSWETSTSTKSTFEAGAGAAYKKFSLQMSITDEEVNKQANSFIHNASSYKLIYIGVEPKPDAPWTNWASETTTNPFPLFINLIDIYQLLVPKYFPSINANILLQKKDALYTYISTMYCDSLQNCRAPETVPQIVNSDLIRGFNNLWCQNVLFCGFLPSDRGRANWPQARFSTPEDGNNCLYYDSDGVYGNAVCASALTMPVMPAYQGTGLVTVGCPIGSEVVSCHAAPINDANYGARSFYPVNKTHCNCYDSNRVRCTALCVAGLGVVIKKASGPGKVSVKCPPGTYVLGCGIDPKNGPSAARSCYAATPMTCVCENSPYTADCYATCGNLNVTDWTNNVGVEPQPPYGVDLDPLNINVSAAMEVPKPNVAHRTSVRFSVVIALIFVEGIWINRYV